MPVPADPRLCLSLPETPDRRRLFIDQGHDEFQVWDGLKMSPGWMGAALSYKHLFTRLNSEKAGRAVVCEDDALFPPDFERRFKTVLRYLEKTPFEIFSGFIADANENLVITKVEEFEGELFIHIDRTVSMVFNIYSDTIIEYLSGWDIADLDVETNTIDRYLERRTGTKAILTLPYLVQHRPDAASTIWGFDNTAYDELTTQSEILLARKVDEFRRKHEKGN